MSRGVSGAGEGNRTLLSSLGSSHSTNVLHLQIQLLYYSAYLLKMQELFSKISKNPVIEPMAES